MAINITIGEKPKPAPQDVEPIKISIGEKAKEKVPENKYTLNARKSLDGNIMIFDHRDIDIVIMPKKRKVMAFPKEVYDETNVYETQDRLFKFLSRKGVVELDSVQGGNIFMSMEAKYPKSDEYNATQIIMMNLGKFIEQEKPYYEYEAAWEDEQERRLTEPEPEESTELDTDKYHSAEKGSLRPSMKPYGIAGIYRVFE